jgi:hypothetical protein
MENTNTQTNTEVKTEEPIETPQATNAADVPSYKIGGVFMLTILSFALFLNVFVVGLATLVMHGVL